MNHPERCHQDDTGHHRSLAAMVKIVDSSTSVGLSLNVERAAIVDLITSAASSSISLVVETTSCVEMTRMTLFVEYSNRLMIIDHDQSFDLLRMTLAGSLNSNCHILPVD